MKKTQVRTKRILAWLLTVSVVFGNFSQTVMAEGTEAQAGNELAYYVNCGGTELPEGEEYGIYNGNAVDRVYDETDTLEYHWGYDSGYEYESGNPNDYDGHTTRLILKNDAATLSYYFELPAGNYNVEVSLPHCVHWGNRVMDVNVQVGDNEKKNLISNLNTTDDIALGSLKTASLEFAVTEAKQMVTVSAVRSNENAWAPFLGYIKIAIIAPGPVEDELIETLEGAESLYRTENADHIYTADTWKTFTDAYDAAQALIDSKNVSARAQAIKNLLTAKDGLKETALYVDDKIAYYVNCGGVSLPAEESYGIYNRGVVDQAYDPSDETQSYHWGYDSGYEYESGNPNDYDGHTTRLILRNDAATLSYYFELPAGNYNVEVNLPHCIYYGNRVMDVNVQVGDDEKKNLISNLNTTDDIALGSLKTANLDFAVTGEKQIVTVSAVRSNENAWAPFLGYIKISVNNVLLKALEKAEDVYKRGNADGYYTADTWQAFTAAYDEALALKESEEEARREAAAEKLVAAQKNLKRANTRKWFYDFEGSTNDADLVVNQNGISSYSGNAVYGEGRNGGQSLRTGSYGLRLNKRDLGNKYTVNMWVKATSAVPYNTPVIFLGYNNPEKWLGIAGNGSPQECKIWTRANGIYKTLNKTVNMPVKEWVMHTIQSDGTTTKFYENGKLAAQSEEIADVLTGSNQDIYLCVNFWDGQLKGYVDDVSVYDECLSAEEVYQLYDPRDAETALKEDGFTVPEKRTLTVDMSKYIKPVLPENARDAAVRYTSSDPTIVSVGNDGKIIGEAVGTADITTTVTVGKTAISRITSVTVRSREDMVNEEISYFVDCGNEGETLVSADQFGRYNRMPDQKLGADPVTGKIWGWGKIGNNDPVRGTNILADEDSGEYTWKSAGSGSDFYYEFELPANVYQVEVTIPYFLDGGNTRTFEVIANNGTDASEYETIANNINTKYITGAAKTYTGICTANGTDPLRISFLSDSDAWGPIVSMIKIIPASREAYIESLKDTLQKAKSYAVEDYSDTSYAVLADAIHAAEENLDSIATAKEAKELEDAIKEAIRKLVPGVNGEKAKLRALISQAKTDYKKTDYTADSYAALEEAVKKAEEQMDSVDTVSGVMYLEHMIRQAISALKKTEKPKIPVSYKVTFNSAGGSSVAAQTVKDRAKASKPKNPTRSKYIFKGWYLGKKKYDFGKAVTKNIKLTAKWTKVTVGNTSITHLKNKKAKKCTVQIKKVSGAAGYQYVYSTDKKFKKSVKKVKGKSVKIILSKLKKGKTYYVKVRAYKYDSKKKPVYGKYSAKKKVVIKK